MFAVIETGGKQYKVNEGDIIFVEKLDVNDGDTVTLTVTTDKGTIIPVSGLK